MTSTRWMTLSAFVVGSAGLVIVSTSDSVLTASAGAAMVTASAIALVRHFWRQGEMSRHKHSTELAVLLTESRKNSERWESALDSGFSQLSARVDSFARGVLEYVAQIQLDIETLDRKASKHREQIMSQLEGVIGLYATLKPKTLYPPFGGWAIGGDCARRLVALILAQRPGWIIEVGSGLSTLIAAQALDLIGGEGRLMALEHEEVWLERSIALLTEHEVSHRAEVIHAPLVQIDIEGESYRWYDLTEAKLPDQAEIIFIDGPPKAVGPLARYPALPLLLDHLGPTGVVLMDDASRPDEVAVIERWKEEVPGLEVTKHADSKGTVEIRRGSA